MQFGKMIAFSLFTLLVSVPLDARSDCVPQSEAELRKTFVEQSPFQGEWRLRTHSGPTSFDFATVAGVTYVEWRSSDEHGNMGPSSGYLLSFPARNKVTFDSGKYGEIRLRLSEDCRLAGTQNHPNGRTTIDAKPVAGGRGGRSESAPIDFTSSPELVAALKSGSPFHSVWRWGSRSGKGEIRYHDKDGVFSATEDDGLTVPIEVLSPSRFSYRLPGDRGTVTLEMQKDGTLMGVQSYEGKYAVLIESNPTRPN